MFEGLPVNHYRAILADPPWRFEHWGKGLSSRDPANHYPVMTLDAIKAMPVNTLAAEDSVLFLWATWPMLSHALDTIAAWGFTYKTCAFCWVKADVSTLDMFSAPKDADMMLGYWTRANSEPCLLATRGKPKRIDAGVRQGIIEPAREHSRKPDCVRERIARLVEGPYLELFARSRRLGWDGWGNETEKFGAPNGDDIRATTA